MNALRRWALFLCLVHCAKDITASGAGPVTRSPSGSFRGSWMQSRRGRRFHAYRGIRYAAPPVGSLRFQPPQPILTYPEVVDATLEGPSCPRPASPGYPVHEDCLVLNVYTPYNNGSQLLPVIFFIHAGGFYTLSGRSDVAGPHYLLDQDVLLVTINYRLGSLGFLALGTRQAPGNNGFKDQVAALRWVQRNIAAFGGDPGLVTIAGCSAGAVSVGAHMVAPMSKGLFHRAIAMSGSPFSKVPSPPHRMDLAITQAKVSGCPTDNATAIYDCLMTKSWREIAGSLLGFFEFGFDPLSLWRPVVEPNFGQDRFLPVEPIDTVRAGALNSVPLMLGQTTDEFYWKAYTVLRNKTLLDTMNAEWDRVSPISFILPRDETRDRLRSLREAYLAGQPLVNDVVTTGGLGKLYGDAITAFPVHRMANLMCRHSRHPVYYYQFAYLGNHSHYEDPITKKPVHVVHHDDLIYLFTLSYRFPTIDSASSPDSQMVDKMTTLWYNFAKYGNPSGMSTQTSPQLWPAMTPTERQYLKIDQEFSVHQNLFEDRFKVWDELYPIQY